MLAIMCFWKKFKAKISITASDISNNVLKQAKAGTYSEDKISKLPQVWVEKFLSTR